MSSVPVGASHCCRGGARKREQMSSHVATRRHHSNGETRDQNRESGCARSFSRVRINYDCLVQFCDKKSALDLLKEFITKTETSRNPTAGIAGCCARRERSRCRAACGRST